MLKQGPKTDWSARLSTLWNGAVSYLGFTKREASHEQTLGERRDAKTAAQRSHLSSDDAENLEFENYTPSAAIRRKAADERGEKSDTLLITTVIQLRSILWQYKIEFFGKVNEYGFVIDPFYYLNRLQAYLQQHPDINHIIIPVTEHLPEKMNIILEQLVGSNVKKISFINSSKFNVRCGPFSCTNDAIKNSLLTSLSFEAYSIHLNILGQIPGSHIEHVKIMYRELSEVNDLLEKLQPSQLKSFTVELPDSASKEQWIRFMQHMKRLEIESLECSDFGMHGEDFKEVMSQLQGSKVIKFSLPGFSETDPRVIMDAFDNTNIREFNGLAGYTETNDAFEALGKAFTDPESRGYALIDPKIQQLIASKLIANPSLQKSFLDGTQQEKNKVVEPNEQITESKRIGPMC